jgi:pyruvate ferredoxin oxidoreductase beta subunit
VKRLSEWKFTSKEFAQIPEKFAAGHRACAGCGPATALRLVMKATRGPVIATNATGCMEVVSTIYPYTAWKIPWMHTAFETAAANASGIETALKILRKKGKIKDEHVDVVAFAGDGGTFDIGFQALSGAVERGHDFLYVLYDSVDNNFASRERSSRKGRIQKANSGHYGCSQHALRCHRQHSILERHGNKSPKRNGSSWSSIFA